MTEDFDYYKAILELLEAQQLMDPVKECETMAEYSESLKVAVRMTLVLDPESGLLQVDELKRGCLEILVRAITQFENAQVYGQNEKGYGAFVLRNAVYMSMIRTMEELFDFLVRVPQLKQSEL